MKDLVNLKDTQESIQSLVSQRPFNQKELFHVVSFQSAWCLRNRKSSLKIARCWLKVTKKVEAQF